tara:strand:+ start:4038 stop:5306 length:1269 start_codon:yes stop_codon:yes gene_type:complete
MESIEAWFPRGLVVDAANVVSAPVTAEGLCPLRISWEKEKINGIEAINDYVNAPSKLLLPRLVEPHAHLDKIFTWKKFPNLAGTYGGALEANLEEHQARTAQGVRFRAEKALNLALKNGLRSVRTHVDSFGLNGEQSLQVLIDLKEKWKSLIELQFVALVPLDYWNSSEGSLLATRVSGQGGLLGGVIAPPFDKRKSYRDLLELFKLARQLECGVDLHIDEADTCPAAGLNQLIEVLEHLDVNVPITCSHSSSMGLLPATKLRHLAAKLAQYKINVIAMPFTNSWLLGRKERETPIKRPLAPIRQLQQAGVVVGVGGDNIQDPWFPFGNLDPISLMAFAMPLTQLAPWERLGLAPFTTSAATLMELEWDGTIQVGSPSDFILLDASSWTEALSTFPSRQIIIGGEWFNEEKVSMITSGDLDE